MSTVKNSLSNLGRTQILAGSALCALFWWWPSTAEAHLRWFVSSTDGFEDPHYPLDGLTFMVTIGAVCFGAAIYSIHVWLREPLQIFRRILEFPEEPQWRLLAVLCGVALLDNVRTGVFLAPNLTLSHPSLVTAGAVAQSLLAILLIFQVSFVLSGALVGVAVAIAGLCFPALLSLDYVFEFSFLAASLILIGPRLTRIDRRLFASFGWNPNMLGTLALPVIRVGIGVTLVILAVHNKLASPGLALAFLSEHPYNFMPVLGFAGFTDLHFAFAAGVGELTLGLLLIAGLATRLVTLLLTGFFITTIFLLGVAELTGHLPILGIAILLLGRGSGSFEAVLPGRQRLALRANPRGLAPSSPTATPRSVN